MDETQQGDENQPREITVRDLMPYMPPDGVPHVRLGLANMENAGLREENAALRAELARRPQPSDDEIHALLGDARSEPSA